MSHSVESMRSGEVILQIKGELATIYLGSSDEKVVILDSQRLSSLLAAVEKLASSNGIKGLVIIGPSENMFCAGADINIIASIESPDKGRELAKKGQDIFVRLAALPMHKVAAISGPCVGGGCELVLACDYRLITAHPKSKIGLPEVQLGILPGFGGTQRLPRLVGLPVAADIILNARSLDPQRALKRGLVDSVLGDPPEGTSLYAFLKQSASELALGRRAASRKRMPLRERLLTYTGIGRSLVERRTRHALEVKTKGQYPAPARALDSVLYGLKHSVAEGLDFEARRLGELVCSKECKALLNIYFASEASSKIGRPLRQQLSGAKVAIVGGGVMGAGIAACCVSAGLEVSLVEVREQVHSNIRSRVDAQLSHRRFSFSSSKKQEYLSRLKLSTSMDAISGSDIVIEAVFEQVELKQQLLGEIQQRVSETAIIASNTSSLSIRELSSVVENSERFVGIHFFNPPEKMRLVEIVWGENTEDRAVATAAALASLLGKYPVVVEDVPGFLVNRILTPYLLEAAHLLEEGYGITYVDGVAEQFGMPMGPFRLLDEVGLDIGSRVAQSLELAYGERMRAPGHLAKLEQAGFLGKKSGKGFYVYDGDVPRVNQAALRVLALNIDGDESKKSDASVQDRLILPMVNEAVRCLEGKVAGDPGRGAAMQIDLATVMGLGFAPFRGGIIHYAESLHAPELSRRLTALEKAFGARFAPAAGITERLTSGKGFYD